MLIRRRLIPGLWVRIPLSAPYAHVAEWSMAAVQKTAGEKLPERFESFHERQQKKRSPDALVHRGFSLSNMTFSHFNLTQPVRVATANLYKRSNKLPCILYNVCLLFDQTIWSDTTYCNGIISFLYNIWCEAIGKTMLTYHSHL